ncbi:MAG: glycoside hydrolase [Eubacterium sp.]
MKRTKKLLALFLSVVMLVSAIPITAYSATKAPAKPKSVSAASTVSSVTVKWKKVSGATGYAIYKYNTSTKKYSKVASTKKVSYKVSKLKAGTTYVYAVKAYKTVKKKNYYSGYSSKVTVSTLPSKPTGLKKTAASANSISVSWSKVSGATGYAIYSYNTSSKKYSKIASTKNLSYKVGNLKAGTTYVYAVRAYRTVSKKTYYSDYSSRITLSTLPAKVTGLKKIAVTANSISVSWSKVTGATGYKLQYSTNKNFSSGVKTINQTAVSKTITSLNSNTTYYFRVYAYRTVNKLTYTSTASAVLSAATQELFYATKSEIDESATYQTIEGFGASGAWWAQRIGRWSEDGLTKLDDGDAVWTKPQTEKAIKYLYDPVDGIGLNIYRYNLGTDSYKDEHITNKWERTEGFVESVNEQTGEITYDWSKDAAAQNTLSVVKQFAGDDLKLTLFCNSPPTQLTDNGKAYCSYNSPSATSIFTQNTNLSADKFTMFADFLVDAADHFQDQGYNVKDISPVNEPQYSWSCDENGYMNQEGSHYTPSQLASLLAVCAQAGEGRDYKFSMFESGGADAISFEQYVPVVMKNSINAAYYDSVSTHSYWQDKAAKQETFNYVKSNNWNLKFACTEYCQMTNDTNTGVFDISSVIEWWDPARNGLTIEYGVQLARTVLEDLTVLNATEWDWWTGCSGGYYPDGLVYLNYSNPDDIQTSKRLWCLGNFSKFIDEGAVRVKVTEAQSELMSCAFKNPDGSLAVVYVNQNNKNITTNIKASGYKSYETYVTNSDKDLELNQSGSYAYANSISVPAQSVVTVVLK